jgi:UDP-glucuronate decarboxylase
LFFDYHRQHGVRIKVARIFNTYGPRMRPDDGRVVSNFIMRALRDEPITIYGDGSQTRSFGYVDDLVEGITRLMASNDSFLGPVNLGNPIEMTVRELAEQVVEMTGSRSRQIFKPLPVDDPKQRRPDITLARQKLNWTPKVPLSDGIEHTVAYFRSVLAGNHDGENQKLKPTTVKKSPLIQSEASVL